MKHSREYFYSHLIEIESIVIELDKMDFSDEEKMELSTLIDSSLHHVILNAVLSELSEGDKHTFFNHLRDGDNEKVMDYLNTRVDHIEDKIKKAADELKEEMKKDIKKAYKKHQLYQGNKNKND